jgi:tagatose 1,6-diphosphate aldolase GatY/KbaY
MRANLADIATDRRSAGAALPAFTSYDLATARGAVRAAEQAGTPVALLVSPRTANSRYGLDLIRALRALADAATVGVCVQLDHAVDVDLITAAVEAGADSVLVDGSRRNPRGNADFVDAVRSDLTPRYPHLVVEAELGRIEGNEDIAAPATAAGLTDPAQVPDFLDRSGTDLLAVSIGNVHGRYAAPPRLDFARLADIRARTDTPLVLHGASGLTPADLARAIELGACKVNVNTELRQTIFDTLTDQVSRHREHGLDLDGLLAAWSDAVTERATEIMQALAHVPGPDLSTAGVDS